LGAPALDTLNVRAVKVSDLVLVPVRTSGPDVKGKRIRLV
jgi:hypothetical protein